MKFIKCSRYLKLNLYFVINSIIKSNFIYDSIFQCLNSDELETITTKNNFGSFIINKRNKIH